MLLQVTLQTPAVCSHAIQFLFQFRRCSFSVVPTPITYSHFGLRVCLAVEHWPYRTTVQSLCWSPAQPNWRMSRTTSRTGRQRCILTFEVRSSDEWVSNLVALVPKVADESILQTCTSSRLRRERPHLLWLQSSPIFVSDRRGEPGLELQKLQVSESRDVFRKKQTA